MTISVRQSGAAISIPSATYGTGRRSLACVTRYGNISPANSSNNATIAFTLYTILFDNAGSPTQVLGTMDPTTGVVTPVPSAVAVGGITTLGRSSRLAPLLMGEGDSGSSPGGGFAFLSDALGNIGQSGNDYWGDTVPASGLDFWGIDYAPMGSSRAVALADKRFLFADNSNLIGQGGWTTGNVTPTSPIVSGSTAQNANATGSDALLVNAITGIDSSKPYEVLMSFTRIGNSRLNAGYLQVVVGDANGNYVAFGPDYTNNHGFPGGQSNSVGSAVTDSASHEIDHDALNAPWANAQFQRYIMNPDTSCLLCQNTATVDATAPIGVSLTTPNLELSFYTYGTPANPILSLARVIVNQPTTEIVMAVMHDAANVLDDTIAVYQMPTFPGDGSGGNVSGYLTTLTPIPGRHGVLSGLTMIATGMTTGYALVGITGGYASTGTLLVISDTAVLGTSRISGWAPTNATASGANNIIAVAAGTLNADGTQRIWVLTDDFVNASGATVKNLIALDVMTVVTYGGSANSLPNLLALGVI